MFRGYVITKGKRCLEKFKDVANLKSYDDVKNEESFAGILDGHTILLDFDDKVQADIAFQIVKDYNLKCRVVKTNKGYHIFFKNRSVKGCKTATRLACGLRADIKVGENSYAIVKLNGHEREVVYDTDEYEFVPKFFQPVKSTIEFLEMKEGEGRNDSLFRYILTLQGYGYAGAQIKKCLEIINKYVLDEPLSDAEMDVIMRDESFEKPVFFHEKTFLFDRFAEYLRDTSNIVKIDGRLHIYENGVYVDSSDLIESEMIRHIPNLNHAKRQEVLSYLNILIRDNTNQAPAQYIAFKNGIYDIIKDELLPFSDKFVIVNKINYNYNPAAQSDLLDHTLDKLSCNDKDIRALLEEMVGYCFYRRNELGKAFILVGDGSIEKGASNGKSTFLDMVRTLLGDGNICSLDLAELSERFQNAEMVDKLANIGDDIADGYIPNSAIFKKLVTGERIQAQRKFEKPFEFNNYAKMLFSANEVPKIKDRGGAIQRRLIIIPFLAHFSKNDPDFRPYIKYELREAENIEYLIKLGIEGLKRILQNQAFTQSDKVNSNMEEFEENNNPIIGFFNEYPDLKIENETNTSVYMVYAAYCNTNGHHPLSKVAFSKQITKRFDMEVKPVNINGRTQRVFVKKK